MRCRLLDPRRSWPDRSGQSSRVPAPFFRPRESRRVRRKRGFRAVGCSRAGLRTLPPACAAAGASPARPLRLRARLSKRSGQPPTPSAGQPQLRAPPSTGRAWSSPPPGARSPASGGCTAEHCSARLGWGDVLLPHDAHCPSQGPPGCSLLLPAPRTGWASQRTARFSATLRYETRRLSVVHWKTGGHRGVGFRRPSTAGPSSPMGRRARGRSSAAPRPRLPGSRCHIVRLGWPVTDAVGAAGGLQCGRPPGRAGPGRAPAAMSAYHWEARRRQMVLERRRQKMEEAAEKVPENRLESSTAQPPPPLPQATCPCQCKCHSILLSSARLQHRFSTVQYLQQW